jgi:hypothetical protein
VTPNDSASRARSRSTCDRKPTIGKSRVFVSSRSFRIAARQLPFAVSSISAAAVFPSRQTAGRSFASMNRTGMFRWRAVASIFDRKNRSSTHATSVLLMGAGILQDVRRKA